MIADEKRREIAASLRESANVGGARTLKRELAKALGIRLDDCTPESSHTKILRGLADLVDRPTCQIRLAVGSDRVSPIVNYDGRFLYECTNCRCQAFLSHEAAAQIGERRKYCSNCGAEVVEND